MLTQEPGDHNPDLPVRLREDPEAQARPARRSGDAAATAGVRRRQAPARLSMSSGWAGGP